MVANLPRGNQVQVAGRPTQDNSRRLAQTTQDNAEAFSSNGSNITTGTIQPGVLPIATTTSLGVVEPDGTTITITTGGVITAVPPVSTNTAFFPGFVSNLFYTCPLSANISGATLSANILNIVPFYVPTLTVFTKMSAFLSATGTATSAELGIYSNNNGVPLTLEYDAGTISPTGSLAVKELTGLSLSLVAGWHWLVIGANGGCGFEGNTTNIQGFLGASTLITATTGYTAPWTFSAGNLPLTIPTLTQHSTATALPMLRL